jgi:hypothetical protein
MSSYKTLLEQGDLTRVAASMRESGRSVVNAPGFKTELKVLDLA